MNVQVLVYDFREGVQVEVFADLDKAKQFGEEIAREDGPMGSYSWSLLDGVWSLIGSEKGRLLYIEENEVKP